ncbi:MAG TPA: MAPEG family protein [Candidatus Limnocylindrales bacterium]|nr:MAPEG family protein [Candidatus Limnocylindrales bacterium]
MNPAMRAYAVTTVLLFFKMVLNSTLQGYHRMGRRQFVHAEDAKFFGGASGEDLPAVQRLNAVWRNDLENIPIFLFLALVFVLVEASPDGAGWYFGTFVAARYAHTFFFINGVQPWRFLAYTLGQLVCLGLAVRILLQVL